MATLGDPRTDAIISACIAGVLSIAKWWLEGQKRQAPLISAPESPVANPSLAATESEGASANPLPPSQPAAQQPPNQRRPKTLDASKLNNQIRGVDLARVLATFTAALLALLSLPANVQQNRVQDSLNTLLENLTTLVSTTESRDQREFTAVNAKLSQLERLVKKTKP